MTAWCVDQTANYCRGALMIAYKSLFECYIYVCVYMLYKREPTARDWGYCVNLLMILILLDFSCRLKYIASIPWV